MQAPKDKLGLIFWIKDIPNAVGGALVKRGTIIIQIYH